MIRRLLLSAVPGLAVALSGTHLAAQNAPQTHTYFIAADEVELGLRPQQHEENE